MLKADLIFPIKEAEWVNPIVIKSKREKSEIRVCVDYRSLNNACIHDPFPTPFSDEVLDNVAGKEAYSLTDGFRISSSENSRRRQKESYFHNRMGIICLPCHAFWTKECTSCVFTDSDNSI